MLKGREARQEVTHEDWVMWTDQIENSLARAEAAGKDKDLIVLLRLAWQIGRDHLKERAKAEQTAEEINTMWEEIVTELWRQKK